jgi:hypothetical protein
MEPTGVERLVADLGAARAAAARLAGAEPLGLRAVEPPGEGRWYLCAFEGPSFLCLTASLEAEPDEHTARRVAAAALLVEHVEGIIDPSELRLLATLGARVVALTDDEGVVESLGALADAAIRLADWREAPERALASIAGLDEAAALHEAARTAYAAFVRATDPLVAVQDRLPAELVQALTELEEAAGRAGIGTSLADRICEDMADVDEAALQLIASHRTPLRDGLAEGAARAPAGPG